MSKSTRLLRFRVLVHGDGSDAAKDYLGFYATRDIEAVDVDEARKVAKALIESTWRSQAPDLVSVEDVVVLDVRPLRWSFMRRPPRGFTFFADDRHAQDAALRIERQSHGM